jgi:hypothetical protein
VTRAGLRDFIGKPYFISQGKVQSIIGRELAHLSPQEYCVGLVLCISAGVVLLRGKN